MDYVGLSVSLTHYLRRRTGRTDLYAVFHPITAADILDTDGRASRYDVRIEITNPAHTDIFVGYLQISSGDIFERMTTLNAIPFLQQWLREVA